MAAHLARHLSGSHGVAAKGGNARKPKGRKAGYAGKRRGRMPAAVAKLNLGAMSADELAQVIVAARSEVQHRIASLQNAID